MKRILVFLLPVVTLFSCQSGGNRANEDSDSSASNKSETTEIQNDRATGDWQSLFNGKDLTGWRGFQDKATDAWEVKNGVLHCDGHKENAAHTDLITDEQYKDFVLSLQWKISPESNSGIMFHVTEDQPRTFLTGPEYQIIDDKGWPGK